MAPRSKCLVLSLAALALAIAIAAPAASARKAYVADYETDTVSVVDLAAGALTGTQVSTGPESGPFSLAITPDGKTAWVMNYDDGTFRSLDTASNLFLGSPIPIQVGSYGLAIDPDGTRAYVTATEFESIEVIDLNARARVGAPIQVGEDPVSIAVSPDGARAYVSVEDAVAIVDLASAKVVGSLPSDSPYYASITPDGRQLFVPSDDGLTVFDTATNQPLGPPIPIGETGAEAVAITRDGTKAYVTSNKPDAVIPFDVATRQPLSAPIALPNSVEFLAATPDGKRVIAELEEPGALAFIDTATNQLTGTPIPFGPSDGQVAVVPDRSPSAVIGFSGRARPGVPYILSGAGSVDPDGTVASWAWKFGDGKEATVTTPTTTHAYAKPGKFRPALTVTDDEGCGEALVFTGQTALCSGPVGPPSPTPLPLPLVVSYPGVKVRCPASSPGPCRFKLVAVQRRKGKLKAQSSLARGKAKPGKATTILVKPKKKFAKRLAPKRKLLVNKTVVAAGETTVTVRKLKVVR